MSTPAYRLSFVEPLGLGARETREILRERKFPAASFGLHDSTGEHDGAITDEGGEAAWVSPLGDDSLERADFIVLGGGSPRAIAAARAAQTARPEVPVIELAATPGTAPSGRLALPGLSTAGPDLAARWFRIPDPVTVMIARLLAPLERFGPVEAAVATVVEPVSIHGEGALEEMLVQATSLLNFQPLPKKVTGRQVVFNLFPAATAGPDVAAELSELFGRPVPMVLTRLRGPSFHGHGLSLYVRFGDAAPTREAVEGALDADPRLRLDSAEVIPGTVESAGTDEIIVASISAAGPGAFTLWAAADLLRVGPPLVAAETIEALAGITGPAPSAPQRVRRMRR